MNRNRTLLFLSFLSFFLLGIGASLMGIAWPSVRHTFGLSLEAIGWLLLTSTSGFFLASVSAGRLISRWGIGRLLLTAAGLFATGLAAQAAAPSWWLMVAAAGLAGWASGAIDAGFNVTIAADYSARVMNWMHGFFGVGATAGPLMMTAVFNQGWSWRVGFGLLACWFAALAILFAFMGKRLGNPAASSAAAQPATSYRQTGQQPIVWLGILLFFIYSGIEGTAGQWTYSLFTEARGVQSDAAGYWVSLYWGGLTAGRLLLGTAVHWIGAVRLVQLSMAGVVAGTLLLWPDTAVFNISGMILTGFSLAAIFPTLMSLTPERVTPAHAANAIGFQTGAASLGIAFLPGLAGVLADGWGLETIIPFMLAAAVLLGLVHQLALVRANGRQPAGALP